MAKINIHIQLDVPAPGILEMNIRYQRPGLKRFLPFRSSNGVLIDIVGPAPALFSGRTVTVVGIRSDTSPPEVSRHPVRVRVPDPVVTRKQVLLAAREFRRTVNSRG